jgi:hypothetical protein
LTCDRALVIFFLEKGADPVSDYPFARTFRELRAKTTLGSHEACAFGSVEILKRLKPTREYDLAGMLERAAFSAHREILEYLLDLGANPNDEPDGGSSALEACIRHLAVGGLRSHSVSLR